jgi:hypothetical protein
LNLLLAEAETIGKVSLRQSGALPHAADLHRWMDRAIDSSERL